MPKTTASTDNWWEAERRARFPRRNGHSEDWNKMDRDMIEKLATNRSFSAYQRLGFLVWANVEYGERVWCPPRGYLAFMLDVRSDNVSREVDKAIDHGLIASGSTRYRLVMPEGVRYERRK